MTTALQHALHLEDSGAPARALSGARPREAHLGGRRRSPPSPPCWRFQAASCSIRPGCSARECTPAVTWGPCCWPPRPISLRAGREASGDFEGPPRRVRTGAGLINAALLIGLACRAGVGEPAAERPSPARGLCPGHLARRIRTGHQHRLRAACSGLTPSRGRTSISAPSICTFIGDAGVAVLAIVGTDASAG